MAVHPHAVPQAVGEVLPIPTIGDDFAGGAVQLLTLRGERFSRFDRRGLRVVHEVVDFLELVGGRIAEPDRARDVGRVTLDARPRVDEDHGLARQLTSRRAAVRQRAGWSELDEPAAR